MNLVKISAVTLEDAYQQASLELSCSITEIDIEVIQNPTNGFLGFAKKEAIIMVQKKVQDIQVSQKVEIETSEQNKNTQLPKQIDNTTIIHEIKEKINLLFSKSCFDLEEIHVEIRDNNEVYFEFQGEDSALLIGKEGYRYKAISYILYNWVNMKYGLNMRLEIAEFLRNQEDNTISYLDEIKRKVDLNGRAQTKMLDGVLIKIALIELRSYYPNKYVAIKSSREGGKFIVINDFLSKKQ